MPSTSCQSGQLAQKVTDYMLSTRRPTPPWTNQQFVPAVGSTTWVVVAEMAAAEQSHLAHLAQ